VQIVDIGGVRGFKSSNKSNIFELHVTTTDLP